MKQIILITTLFLFLSCKQGNDKVTTKNSTDYSKENNNQTNDINKKQTSIEKNANEEKKPIETALTFINSYIIDCNKMKESVGYSEFVYSSNLTTKDFKNELKKLVDEAEKIDPELGLDFDPLVDSNDMPEKGFELESYDKKSNFIVVKGKNWDDFKVTIKVVLVDNKWLVDGCGVVNIPKNKQSKR